jgi:hypothetical protein
MVLTGPVIVSGVLLLDQPRPHQAMDGIGAHVHPALALAGRGDRAAAETGVVLVRSIRQLGIAYRWLQQTGLQGLHHHRFLERAIIHVAITTLWQIGYTVKKCPPLGRPSLTTL